MKKNSQVEITNGLRGVELIKLFVWRAMTIIPLMYNHNFCII